MDPIADSRKVLKFGSSVKIIGSRKLFERPPLRMAKQLRVRRVRPPTADAMKKVRNFFLSIEIVSYRKKIVVCMPTVAEA